MTRLSSHVKGLPIWFRWLSGVMCVLALVVFNRSARLSAIDIRVSGGLARGPEVVFVPDQRLSRIMGLGYDQAAADLLWLRTIGYFSKRFLHSRKYAWLEYFVEQLLVLDPHFRKAYHWAGASVLYGRRFTNKNVRLSNRFYELAMHQFPEDYEPAYRLGLNYYFELKSSDPKERQRFKEQGLAYLEQAANAPNAPDLVRNFVASASSKLGKKQLARQYLIDLYLEASDPGVRESLKARITALDEASGAQSAEVATAFQDAWQGTYPYVTASIYALMGEPGARDVPDRAWRDLVPDVDLQADGSR